MLVEAAERPSTSRPPAGRGSIGVSSVCQALVMSVVDAPGMSTFGRARVLVTSRALLTAWSRVRPKSRIVPASARMSSEQHPQERRLAGAVGAKNPVHLALGDLQGDRVHRDQIAIPLGHLDGVDGKGLAHAPGPYVRYMDRG